MQIIFPDNYKFIVNPQCPKSYNKQKPGFWPIKKPVISHRLFFCAVTADLRVILSFTANQIPRLISVAFKTMQQTSSI